MFPTALIFWPHGKLLKKLNFVTDDLVAERFIRTLRRTCCRETFDTIEELRAALIEFARRCNETWLVARR